MAYWIMLIASFVIGVSLLFVAVRKKVKCDFAEEDDFSLLMILVVVMLCFALILSVDIPSALSGGEEIYTNELPTCASIGKFREAITDNNELRYLNGINWNAYEKNGNYRITYTKHTRFVLSIEKLD